MKNLLKRFLALFALFSAELAVVWLAFLVSFILFFMLAKTLVFEQRHGMDEVVFNWILKIRTDTLTSLMHTITFFASKRFLIIFSALLTLVFLFFRNHMWYSIKIPVIVVGSTLLNQFLKSSFGRPRPETALFQESGLSFPSGHAMIGGSLYGILFYLIWTNVAHKGWRLFGCSLVVLWAVLIGFSRIYLNVHYASDVLAGFAMAILWLVLSFLALNALERAYNRLAARMMRRKAKPQEREE